MKKQKQNIFEIEQKTDDAYTCANKLWAIYEMLRLLQSVQQMD